MHDKYGMPPEMLQRLAIAVACSSPGKPHEGVEVAVDMMRQFAPETVPDVYMQYDRTKSIARAALDAWGITYEPGEPLHSLVSSTPTLKVVLPPGWKFSRRGGGGHVELLDARGASRLRWYVHGWEPVSMSVNKRFYTSMVDISPEESVVQVLDGPTVIHTVIVRFPHARLNDPCDDGTPVYKDGWDEDGWTQEMSAQNYKAKEDGYAAGRAWLDENRVGHEDALKSWSL